MPKFSIAWQFSDILYDPALMSDLQMVLIHLAVADGPRLKQQNNSGRAGSWSKKHTFFQTGVLLCKRYWHIFCDPMWQIWLTRGYKKKGRNKVQQQQVSATQRTKKNNAHKYKYMWTHVETQTSLWISSQCRSVAGTRACRLWEPVSGSVCRLDRASRHWAWM